MPAKNIKPGSIQKSLPSTPTETSGRARRLALADPAHALLGALRLPLVFRLLVGVRLDATEFASTTILRCAPRAAPALRLKTAARPAFSPWRRGRAATELAEAAGRRATRPRRRRGAQWTQRRRLGLRGDGGGGGGACRRCAPRAGWRLKSTPQHSQRGGTRLPSPPFPLGRAARLRRRRLRRPPGRHDVGGMTPPPPLPPRRRRCRGARRRLLLGGGGSPTPLATVGHVRNRARALLGGARGAEAGAAGDACTSQTHHASLAA